MANTASSAAKFGQRSLVTIGNLANLLPTGTVLVAETLLPSFTNNGNCRPANRVLTYCLLVSCSLVCFFSAFTDSFIGKDGKLYYGIATLNGLYIFNDLDSCDGAGEEEVAHVIASYKMGVKDFIHGLGSCLMFVTSFLSSAGVESCLFGPGGAGPNLKEYIVNLPLAVAFSVTLVFMLCPTNRRGIGYADTTPPQKVMSNRQEEGRDNPSGSSKPQKIGNNLA
ncbi:hypothetical protein Tsubulata_049008 [Turnera subulata]|uniref:Uncharacterized protein n=1 Tax=Turnera subulata TaxID=218843 RepID=A0A9Q0J6Z0_9ROSI|nr:hypothetical protein Tsubulata_049008 [Turnera subulata]